MHMLTASVFRWMNICHRRVWRDIHVDHTQRDELSFYISAIMDAGVQHEEKIHQASVLQIHQVDQAVVPQIRKVPVGNWREGIQLTQQYMNKQIPVIIGACLEFTSSASSLSTKLGGRVDRLELQTNGFYAPIEIKIYLKHRQPDEFQLSFYVWILCQLQQVATLPAVFWLGINEDGTPQNIAPLHYDQKTFEVQLISALEVIAHPEPEVKLLPECHRCHWYSACYPEAVNKKHVTLLAGLRQTTQQDFAKAGIQTLDQIIAMQPEELRQFRGIKTTAHGFHASARAWVEDQPIWYGSLHPLCRTVPIYFDIETIPFQKPVWSIGWAAEGEPVQVVIVDSVHKSKQLKLPDGGTIALVPDANSAWRYFAESVSNSEAPIFHWTPYDATNLKNEAPIEVRDLLLPRLHDLCKSFDRAVKLPIRGVSLKTVGVHLGFAWRGYESWLAAYRDYQKWLTNRDLKALESACEYQQDDVTAMMIVRHWLAENASPELS